MILPLQNYFAICVCITFTPESKFFSTSGFWKGIYTRILNQDGKVHSTLSQLNEAILACAIFKGFQCTITSSIIPQGRPIHVDLPLIEWH